MRWHRKNKDLAVTPPDCAEASEALETADQQVKEAETADPKITAITKLLSRYGDQNNFAEIIREALGGSR